MSGNDDADAETFRRFRAVISGMDLAQLQEFAPDLTMLGGPATVPGRRPELRTDPPDGVAIYRIRADLDQADPPIWRRLDLRSDLPLDVVHQVLQVAFDWTDSHLYRFAIGGHPFDRTSQLFLCPHDAEEGDLDDEGGVPACDVQLGETLQEPGDVLTYLYDYGDSWELSLRLEKLMPVVPDSPPAVAVAGRRAAPPEDSGGGTDSASIAMVVDDPAHFDLDELNRALRVPYFVLSEYGVDRRMVDLVHRLRYTRLGEDLAQRVVTVAMGGTEPEPKDLAAVLAAHRWFLDRAKGGGIALTSAGYLRPDDVEAASAVVPAMGTWTGRSNRELHAAPLLEFGTSLQAMGLLRKHNGSLLLTRAGAAAQRDRRNCGPIWPSASSRPRHLPPRRRRRFFCSLTQEPRRAHRSHASRLAQRSPSSAGVAPTDGHHRATRSIAWPRSTRSSTSRTAKPSFATVAG